MSFRLFVRNVHGRMLHVLRDMLLLLVRWRHVVRGKLRVRRQLIVRLLVRHVLRRNGSGGRGTRAPLFFLLHHFDSRRLGRCGSLFRNRSNCHASQSAGERATGKSLRNLLHELGLCHLLHDFAQQLLLRHGHGHLLLHLLLHLLMDRRLHVRQSWLDLAREQADHERLQDLHLQLVQRGTAAQEGRMARSEHAG